MNWNKEASSARSTFTRLHAGLGGRQVVSGTRVGPLASCSSTRRSRSRDGPVPSPRAAPQHPPDARGGARTSQLSALIIWLYQWMYQIKSCIDYIFPCLLIFIYLLTSDIHTIFHIFVDQIDITVTHNQFILVRCFISAWTKHLLAIITNLMKSYNIARACFIDICGLYEL